MDIIRFRVQITKLFEKKDSVFISLLKTRGHPDVFFSETPRNDHINEFIIENSPEGLFVIKKLIERFYPTITIYGETHHLTKEWFPKEMFEEVGKRWTKSNIEKMKEIHKRLIKYF